MSQDEASGVGRRAILGAAVAAGAAIAAPALAQTPRAPARPPAGLGAGNAPRKIFQTTEIASGRIMGIANGPIWEFRGIPYGAPTGGRNRYMPPRPPAPWNETNTGFLAVRERSGVQTLRTRQSSPMPPTWRSHMISWP